MDKTIISIGGGKGGVGKSLLAANIAIAIAQLGKSVTLVDADLGAANLHTIFGISRPEHLLEHFINKDIKTLNEAAIETAQPGLKIICGGMAIVGSANPKHFQKLKLIRHLKKLDSEIIILDVSAGVSFNTLDLFNCADIKAIVFTPQLTSLHNGYGFLKSALFRLFMQSIPPEARDILASSRPESGDESLKVILSKLSHVSPDSNFKSILLLDNYNAFIIGNMVHTAKEEHIIYSVAKMVQDHLQIDAPVTGAIRFSNTLQRSVNDRKPFMLWKDIDQNKTQFRKIATALLKKRNSHSNTIQAWSFLEDMETLDEVKPDKTNRKESRYLVEQNLQATFHHRNSMRFVGVIDDISHGGISISFDMALPPKAHGQLVIHSISTENIEVLVKEKHRDKTGLTVGFEFTKLVDQNSDAINAIIGKAAVSTIL